MFSIGRVEGVGPLQQGLRLGGIASLRVANFNVEGVGPLQQGLRLISVAPLSLAQLWSKE